MSDFEKKNGGKGGVQRSGYYLVTEDGGVDPTKFMSQDNPQMKDVTAFLAVQGGKAINAEVSFSGIVEGAKFFKETVEGTTDAVKSVQDDYNYIQQKLSGSDNQNDSVSEEFKPEGSSELINVRTNVQNGGMTKAK